jgi:hypothetical protein
VIHSTQLINFVEFNQIFIYNIYMPKITKSPSPSSQKPEEKQKSFNEVTWKDKVLYVISTLGGKLKSDASWNPQWVISQNKTKLQNTKKWGISALTAIRVVLFVAVAGIMLGSLLVAPHLTLAALIIVQISAALLSLLALLTYNLILLWETPLDITAVNETAINKIVEDGKAPCAPPWEVEDLRQKHEYEEQQARRKAAKESGEEMNAPQYSDQDREMMPDLSAEYNQPQTHQANGQEIEMLPMAGSQNLPLYRS